MPNSDKEGGSPKHVICVSFLARALLLLGADVGAIVPAQVAVALARVAHEYADLVTEMGVNFCLRVEDTVLLSPVGINVQLYLMIPVQRGGKKFLHA